MQLCLSIDCKCFCVASQLLVAWDLDLFCLRGCNRSWLKQPGCKKKRFRTGCLLQDSMCSFCCTSFLKYTADRSKNAASLQHLSLWAVKSVQPMWGWRLQASMLLPCSMRLPLWPQSMPSRSFRIWTVTCGRSGRCSPRPASCLCSMPHPCTQCRCQTDDLCNEVLSHVFHACYITWNVHGHISGCHDGCYVLHACTR